jgi:hypothetical protein
MLRERGIKESYDPVRIAVSCCRLRPHVITKPLDGVTIEVDGHLTVSSHRQNSDRSMNEIAAICLWTSGYWRTQKLRACRPKNLFSIFSFAEIYSSGQYSVELCVRKLPTRLVGRMAPCVPEQRH